MPDQRPDGAQVAAVVFDCDGVLVDSEPIAWAVWRDLLAPHGVEVTEEDVVACTGRAFVDTHGHFARRAPLPDVPTTRAAFERDLLARYATDLQAFDDAVAVLDAVDEAGLPRGVASSSPRDRLDAALETVGLDARFPVRLAGDEVEHGKPAPDLFADVTRRLGTPPGRTLAIEDTPAGVASAVAAGLLVVAVRREHNAAFDLSDADRVVDRLTAEVLTCWR